jgi:Domain of unknown function (DUF4111)/Nucleotidyltransferase domain
MRAVVLIGSAALGDYVAGVSDLDVAVVSPGPVDDPRALVAPILHRELPCPARKLELVVYRADQAGTPTRNLAFEVDLNTGPDGDRVLTELSGAPGHWYLIDLAIAHEHGVSLAGPPAGEVIGRPPRDDVLDALLAGMRWALEAEPDSPNTVLNALRGRRFVATGAWVSKRAALEWAEAHGLDLDPRAAIAAVEAAR